MKIIEIIGSTLLPEESNFIGFMPLNSYLEKKNVKTPRESHPVRPD